MMRRFFSVLLGALLLMAAEFGSAQAAETIRIGYIPVLGSSALFVLDGKGWAKEAGLDVELVRFTSGPQAIQALTSGRIDGYVAGVLPPAAGPRAWRGCKGCGGGFDRRTLRCGAWQAGV
jgi:NitT/TauT family transport system substrate-binding protein